MTTYKNKADAKRAATKAGIADFDLVEVDGRWGYTDKKPAGSPARGRRLGIGKFMADRIRAGDDTDAILAAVRAQFPDSRAGRSDVSIVRGKVKRGVL